MAYGGLGKSISHIPWYFIPPFGHLFPGMRYPPCRARVYLRLSSASRALRHYPVSHLYDEYDKKKEQVEVSESARLLDGLCISGHTFSLSGVSRWA